MNLRTSSTRISPTPSRNRLADVRRALRSSSALEGVVRRFHQVLPAFNERRLSWDEVVVLAGQLGAPIVLHRGRVDAYLARRFGGTRLVVDQRVNRESWGVFCVMHELTHLVAHPGTREFYVGSPGWFNKTETQANSVALLALAPQPAGPPYPRILSATAEGAVMSFDMTYVTDRISGQLGPRWVTRKVSLQRYA
jgi:hypothetical protein